MSDVADGQYELTFTDDDDSLEATLGIRAKCFICGTTDFIFNMRSCRSNEMFKWVHASCIRRWIQENQGYYHIDMEIITTPQYRRYIARLLPVHLALFNFIDSNYGKMCCFVSDVMFMVSVYFACMTYGAITVIQVFGYNAGYTMLYNQNRIISHLLLPAIPVVLIAGHLTNWRTLITNIIYHRTFSTNAAINSDNDSDDSDSYSDSDSDTISGNDDYESDNEDADDFYYNVPIFDGLDVDYAINNDNDHPEPIDYDDDDDQDYDNSVGTSNINVNETDGDADVDDNADEDDLVNDVADNDIDVFEGFYVDGNDNAVDDNAELAAISIRNEVFDSFSEMIKNRTRCIYIVFLPSCMVLFGRLLFSSVQSPVRRTLCGGLAFVIAKECLAAYRRWAKDRNQQRTILDYPKP